MQDRKTKTSRRAQQAHEVEENQSALRKNIAEAARLVDEADKMLRRHHQEREDDEANR